METGTKVSMILHGAVLGLVIFGGPLFNSDDSQAIQIAEVSIITSEEFNSLSSSAPTPDVAIDPQPKAPETPEDAPETPVSPQVDAPEAPETPEPVETQTAELAPDVQSEPDPLPESVEAPEVADTAQEATGSAVVVPDAQVSTEDSPGQVDNSQLALLRPKPRPAPRIADSVNEKPETDAETSQETQEATTPSEKAEVTEQVEAKEETAPQESTTQITPDADPDSAAPIKSARPKGRPSDLNQRAIAAREAKERQAAAEEQAQEEARKAAEAKAIADALKEVQNAASANQGPPLTGSEKGALVLAVQQCWNVPVGVQDAGNLVVVLSVELTPDGKLAGNPTLIDPSGSPQGLIKQAYEAGRRALIRCAPYNLPREKYEQWKTLEVVFNPQKMVLR